MIDLLTMLIEKVAEGYKQGQETPEQRKARIDAMVAAVQAQRAKAAPLRSAPAKPAAPAAPVQSRIAAARAAQEKAARPPGASVPAAPVAPARLLVPPVATLESDAPLLAAFSSVPQLLGAIVVSEALAPPLALRPRGLH